ncbi:hypothetical protein [Pontibacillus sp. HMF3514]|uniref:sunset domain-containing protein n=1 Tax=Pontibacillus sp. HMF3514 TaxID=2692425 RepID=UPI00131FDEF1|nr:hypothetical protein [Pontibacillus sp. HMF3514]QHE50764.1 hypothetical protein GS400_01240 [Pontibacillus sp. HMF3514]
MKIIVKVLTYAGLIASGFLMGMVYSSASTRKTDTSKSPSVPATQELAPTQQPPTPQIKGNRNGRGELIYHVPGGQYYNRVKGQVFFQTEEEAQQAGYRKSQR